MSRWAVRWRRALVSGRAPPARRSARAARRATIRTWSPNGSGIDLVDVTYSGATTANVLTDPQHGAPPQIDALDGSEDLVTVTIGGNDVGYVPLLFAAGLPRLVRVAAAARRPAARAARPARARSRAGRGRRIAQGGRPHAAAAVAAGEGAVRRLPDAAAAGGHARAAAVRHRSSRPAATSPTRWNGSPPRPPPTPAAGWCASPRPAATTTPGRPTHGRRSSACRCRVDPRRCIPTPQACARSPTWSSAQAT